VSHDHKICHHIQCGAKILIVDHVRDSDWKETVGMNGIIALVAGTISLIVGALSFTVGRGALIVVFVIITGVAWGFAFWFGNRAWKNKQAIGLVGLILGLVGFFEMLGALLLGLLSR
jgi:hypothetical protein